MKKFIAGVMGFMMMGMIVVEAEAASRVSSRSYSAPSRSYSAPKSYAAPKSAPAVSAPSRSTSSNPGLKALGFSKPTPAQTVSRPSVPSNRSTSTVNTSWFGKKSVSSAPASSYRTPVRKVSSPVSYRSNRSVYSSPRTTVVQRNYYSNSYGGYNGYNRGYGGYGHNPYGGYSSGGSSFLYGAAGAVGGMMLYNALSTPHHTTMNSGATAAQIEQAKTDQRIEDKLDMQNQLLMQQRPVAQTPVAQQAQCFLPPDAPLMMNPQFYCGGLNAN